MENRTEYSALRTKLEAFKEIITQINLDIIVLINISAEVENKLRKKNLCREEITLLDEKLNKLIETYEKQVGSKDGFEKERSDPNNSGRF